MAEVFLVNLPLDECHWTLLMKKQQQKNNKLISILAKFSYKVDFDCNGHLNKQIMLIPCSKWHNMVKTNSTCTTIYRNLHLICWCFRKWKLLHFIHHILYHHIIYAIMWSTAAQKQMVPITQKSQNYFCKFLTPKMPSLLSGVNSTNLNSSNITGCMMPSTR